MEEKYYTTSEFSILAGDKPTRIRQMIREGIIDSIKRSNKYLIPERALEQYQDNYWENCNGPGNIVGIHEITGPDYEWWWFYLGKGYKKLRASDKVGKWMFFYEKDYYAHNCVEEAIELGVCTQAKYCATLPGRTGVACFYTLCDDIEENKKIIKYFIDRKLIRTTKSGKYYNISFKFDNQTRNHQYNNEFEAKIRLSDYINLETGVFIK